MNVYLRNKCMVNDLNIGACNSSSCKMTKQRALERHWDSVQLVSLSPFLSACALNRAVLPALNLKQSPPYKLLLDGNVAPLSHTPYKAPAYYIRSENTHRFTK